MNTLTFNNGTVSVGDVFASSWGYEQTNVNFFQVISVHGKTTVTVRQINADTHIQHSMAGYKTPSLNHFNGEPLKRRVRDAYFHERRSPNNIHRDRVITFEQIAE